MLYKAAYRLRKDGKSDHASLWVFPVVWCRWWIVWNPEWIPVAHHTSAHGAQMYISWYELFECGRLKKIGTRPKHILGCQMTIPVCEVSSGGQLFQMQHRDQGEPVLPLHECRRPVGGNSEHITGPSVLCSWRYADWYTSYRSFIFRWSTSCTHTMRSISLDRKERLETGRKFFKISQLSMAFFRSGKMKALFNSGEKSANSREEIPEREHRC